MWTDSKLAIFSCHMICWLLVPLKRQCLVMLSLWQCFPLLGILWRKILLSLQTKSPAVWTIGRAFVFRSGSRYEKVFSNISHSYIVKESIHWSTLKKLAAHLYSGVGHTLLGLAKWLYPVCNWIVPWSLEVIHLLSLCLEKRNLMQSKGFTTNIPKINSRRESHGKRYRINRNRKCKLRKP